MKSILNLENKIYEKIHSKDFSGYYKCDDFSDNEDFFKRNLGHFREFNGYLLLCDNKHYRTAINCGFKVIERIKESRISLFKLN
jgi:hypothetical protein